MQSEVYQLLLSGVSKLFKIHWELNILREQHLLIITAGGNEISLAAEYRVCINSGYPQHWYHSPVRESNPGRHPFHSYSGSSAYDPGLESAFSTPLNVSGWIRLSASTNISISPRVAATPALREAAMIRSLSSATDRSVQIHFLYSRNRENHRQKLNRVYLYNSLRLVAVLYSGINRVVIPLPGRAEPESVVREPSRWKLSFCTTRCLRTPCCKENTGYQACRKYSGFTHGNLLSL